MNRPSIRLALLALSGALALEAGYGQARDLRMMVAGTASLTIEAAEGVRLSMGFSDAAAVYVPKDSPFVQGIEIEVRSPPEATATPGGFAFEIWKSIDPAPERGRYAYRGARVITQPLPARAGYAIQIPVRADHSIEAGPYAELLPAVIDPRDFPIAFKLVPVSKGIPSEIESARFQVRFRLILGDEGALSLKLRYPEGKAARPPVTVTVDDRKIDPAAATPLKAGQHRLRVSSEAYRDESRSFAVESGRTLELVVELQDATPVVIVEAPDSAAVTIDGARVDHVAHPQLEVEPGEHVAVCRIGDYSVTRRFTAARGKTYRLVLQVDLQVQEAQ
jgi:hypothetical protein